MNEVSLDRLRRLEKRLQRRRRITKVPKLRVVDRSNPLECYNSEQFKLRYHMYKETVIYISEIIRDNICCPIRRGSQLDPVFQTLICIRFFVTGSFQVVVGDLHTITQPAVSKIVKRVSTAIACHPQRFIKCPGFAEAARVREAFYDIAKFPGVTGVIDGCQIKIDSPGGINAELYRNRKGYFSMNVQGVCDSQLNFTNIVARWYGSAHDSRIFENSNLFYSLEAGLVPGCLLCDSGYSCLVFALPPIEIPQTPAEKRYNKAQKSTRNIVERCFGVWKRRFPCLNHLRLKLKTSMAVIVATAVLHNISRARNDIFEDDQYDINPNEVECVSHATSSTVTGRAFRSQVISAHFS